MARLAEFSAATAGAPPGPRHVLLTGGSSGIGLAAARELLAAGHRLTLPCRNAASGERLRERLGGSLATPTCDLADLASVENCAARLLAAGEPIDSLVLNAGLQYSGAPEPRWSAQGFELTFAVNHLAHQALLQRLLPLLLAARAPRLVVTASEVHDPASPGGRVGRPASLGDLAGLRRGAGAAMVDGGPFNAEKAYKDSKLCNLLLAREVERRLRQRGTPLPVWAWSPGLVIPRGSGGFFRTSRGHNPVGQALFALLARDLLRLSETPQRAGALLAGLTSGEDDGKGSGHGDGDAAAGFHYWSNRVLGPGRLRFGPSEPSIEARSDRLAQELWQLSAAQLGLTPEQGFAPLPGAHPPPEAGGRSDRPGAPR